MLFGEVKVLIFGQDFYYGFNQVYGLSFFVWFGVCVLLSLCNIYKEFIEDIFGFVVFKYGYLCLWVEQGVLLFNVVFMVWVGQVNSYQGKGWEYFIDVVIKVVNVKEECVVFIFWGSYVCKKKKLIIGKNYVVIELGYFLLFSEQYFFGIWFFFKINEVLEKVGCGLVEWQLLVMVMEE